MLSKSKRSAALCAVLSVVLLPSLHAAQSKVACASASRLTCPLIATSLHQQESSLSRSEPVLQNFPHNAPIPNHYDRTPATPSSASPLIKPDDSPFTQTLNVVIPSNLNASKVKAQVACLLHALSQHNYPDLIACPPVTLVSLLQSTRASTLSPEDGTKAHSSPEEFNLDAPSTPQVDRDPSHCTHILSKTSPSPASKLSSLSLQPTQTDSPKRASTKKTKQKASPTKKQKVPYKVTYYDDEPFGSQSGSTRSPEPSQGSTASYLPYHQDNPCP